MGEGEAAGPLVLVRPAVPGFIHGDSPTSIESNARERRSLFDLLFVIRVTSTRAGGGR